jgi:hypothetical protein
MAQVGSLYTSLTLESSSFISNMKKAADAADRGVGQIDKAFGVLKGAAAGLVAGIGIDAVVGVVNRGLEYASSLGEVSQQLGVTTKDLQVFRYAATQVGIDQETMDKGLAKLTKTLGDAKLGSTSATAAFGQLGISQAQIAKLDTGEAIRLIAERLAKVEDPAKRAAIEVDLFGKAGQKLDTLLAGGRSAVDELATSAEKLGVVLSDENIQKADETADKLSAMKTVLEAKIATTVAENADSILYLADAVFNLTDAMLKGLPAAGRYYAGLAKVYKEDGFFAGLQETFFGTPESNQNTMARGAADGSFRMKGVTGATSFAALDARNAARPDRPVLGSSKPSRSRSGAGSKTPEDIYKGLSASDVRMGGLDTLQDVLGRDGGISQGLKDIVDSSYDFGKQLQDIKVTAIEIPKIDVITPDLLDRAQRFGEGLAEDLGNAVAYGRSLGDVLVYSLRSAGAELISSGLKSLFNGDGGSSSGGGLFGAAASFLGGLFGGGKAIGGPVQPGLAYLVGEKGPEMFMPNGAGTIATASATRAMGSGVVINFNGPVSNPRQVRLAGSQAAARLARASAGGRRGL